MPTHHAARPPHASRSTALALSIGMAALLNLGGLGIADQMAAVDIPTARHPMAPVLRTRVVMLTPDPQPAATSPAPMPLDAVAAMAARPAPAAPRREPTLPELAAESTDDPVIERHSDERPLRLYAFDEVDIAAEPVDDWALDIATLDQAGVSRLVFELLVDERGGVIRCTVLDPTGLDDAMRQQIEQRLAATVLLPAVRSGRFVASARRIVLQVEDVI